MQISNESMQVCTGKHKQVNRSMKIRTFGQVISGHLMEHLAQLRFCLGDYSSTI